LEGHIAAPRIRCLDGLRALSIGLVLLAHLRTAPGAPMHGWPASRAAGVCLFFILSGYLITTLLLDEKQATGTVSLRRFYLRRSLRIMPAAYAMMLAALLLRHIGYARFTNMAFLSSATYWRNYYAAGDWVLDHTWSLSIEEQFYLLWPLLVRRVSGRQAITVALLWIAGWPLLRHLRHGSFVEGQGALALDTAGIDTIVFGCLLALGARDPDWRPRLERFGRWRFALPLSLALIAVLYCTIEYWPIGLQPLSPLLRNIAMTSVLWWCVQNPSTPVGRALAWRPLVFVGVLSYSLYLWQQLFLFPDNPAWICAFPQNLIATFVAALLSYRLVEKPFHALRDRLSRAEQPPAPKQAVMG
jgi:peptidoglycan/LPS O-acetylase OafA/YrhL